MSRSTLQFRPITGADAAAVAVWHYAGPWSVYDSSGDAGLPPAEWRVHAVLEEGELVGYCSFGEDGRVPGFDYDDSAVDVGAGMRPDLTGGGRGGGFLAAILAFGRRELGLGALRCTIAAWNERALRAAARAGFGETDRFEAPDGRRFVVLRAD